MKSKKFKEIPIFKNEEEEANFWGEHDSTEYIDWSKAKRVNPQTKMISIRLPQPLLENIRQIAVNKSLPYQTLIRVWLTEKIKQESISV